MFLLKIFFKLLPLGKCFLMSFMNILPTFVLTLKQYGGLNHMILRLRVFFLFVLVLVVFEIHVMLPWKPLFLSASEYIGIGLIKNNFTGGNVWDTFSYCFRYFFNYRWGGMISFSVDVYRHIIWFSIWSICACV